MLPFEERRRGKLNLSLIDKIRSFRDDRDTVAAEVGIWIGLDTVKNICGTVDLSGRGLCR